MVLGEYYRLPGRPSEPCCGSVSPSPAGMPLNGNGPDTLPGRMRQANPRSDPGSKYVNFNLVPNVQLRTQMRAR